VRRSDDAVVGGRAAGHRARFGKRQGRCRRVTTQWWAVAGTVFATTLAAFGSLYFKLGAKHLEFNLAKLLRNFNLMLGFAFYGLSTVVFVASLRGGQLSVLYPLVSASYIWVTILSIKVLGEKMNKFKWAGIALIVLGVSVIGAGSAV